MKNEQMIKDAYEFFEAKMIEKLGENFNEDFEPEIQNKCIEEMKLQFPEVTEDDISEYQESKNWT